MRSVYRQGKGVEVGEEKMKMTVASTWVGGDAPTWMATATCHRFFFSMIATPHNNNRDRLSFYGGGERE